MVSIASPVIRGGMQGRYSGFRLRHGLPLHVVSNAPLWGHIQTRSVRTNYPLS